MRAFPIIPIWLMIIITVIYLILVFRTKPIFRLIVRILIIIVVFIINIRFMVRDGNAESAKSNLDIILVVDNSISMVAEDYNGTHTRLSAVKDDLKYILDNMPSASYAAITFDSKSYIRSPFTSDRDNLDAIIDTMDVKLSFYSSGSNITIFKENLKYMLENSKKKENHKRIVILVSDGEQTSDESLASLSDLKNLVDDGMVLGYGTSKGGEMKEKKYISSNDTEYIEDRRGRYPYPHAVSKIDESNLKKMADQLGIEYINMSKQSNVDKKIRNIANNSDLVKGDDIESYRDTYYPLAIVLSILIVMELYLDKREYL